MIRLWLMFKREARAFLVSPVYWVLVALAWFLSALSFRHDILIASGGDLAAMIQSSAGLCIRFQLIFVPLLTMRVLAEEKRTGTYEMLVTAPVRDHEVVLAKFLAVFVMNALTWLIIPIWFVVLSGLGVEPDMGVVFTTYLGTVLVGGVFVSAGILASATTQHQILAGFMGVVLLMILLFLPRLTAGLEGELGHAINQVMRVGYLEGQLSEASAGIIDLVSVVYQLSLMGVFLLFSTRILEVRKWR